MEHRGRTSGRRCRTPVVALRIDDGYFISPPLRAKRDRVKNVLAADSCTVERAGQRIARTEPALLRQREGTAPLRWPVWDDHGCSTSVPCSCPWDDGRIIPSSTPRDDVKHDPALKRRHEQQDEDAGIAKGEDQAT